MSETKIDLMTGVRPENFAFTTELEVATTKPTINSHAGNLSQDAELDLGSLISMGPVAECSIVASDVNVMVTKRLTTATDLKKGTLFHIQKNGEVIKSDDKYVVLANLKLEESKRDLDFLLVKPSDANPLAKLVIVARGNVAFTLANFKRKKGSECDYIQIGHEVDDDSLVVTALDDQRRLDVVMLIGALISPKDFPNIRDIADQRNRHIVDEKDITQLLVQKFNVDSLIDKQLGEYSPDVDAILKYIGYISSNNLSPITFEYPAILATGHRTTARVTVSAETIGTATDNVRIDSVAKSQDDSDAKTILNADYNKTEVVDIPENLQNLLKRLLAQAVHVSSTQQVLDPASPDDEQSGFFRRIGLRA